MFRGGLTRSIGDVGFIAWCLCGAAYILVVLTAPHAPDLAAGVVVPVETPAGVRYATYSLAFAFEVLFWACSGGFFVWLTSLAAERLIGAG